MINIHSYSKEHDIPAHAGIQKSIAPEIVWNGDLFVSVAPRMRGMQFIFFGHLDYPIRFKVQAFRLRRNDEALDAHFRKILQQ